MTETLFGASPTIGFADNAEDVYSMGTRVTFAVAGQITGARIWGTTNAVTSSPSAAIYTTGGSQQAVKALGAYSTAAWNTVTFDTPFSVLAGSTYDIVFGPLNRYAGNTSVFPLTVGDLTGVKGRFIAAGSLSFPTNDSSGSGSTWYGIDVLFTPAAANDIALDGNRSETVTIAGALGRTAGAGGSADLSATIAGALSVSSGGTTPPTTTHTGSGWWSWKSILDEAAQEAQYYQTRQPVACPNDGEPLTTAPDGTLFCRFDGWPNV